MNHTERSQRRVTFAKAAEDYDAVRPGYPIGMYEDLITYAQLAPSARILEIGCGSGQATLPLAKLGYRITAIDISSELTAIAQAQLAPFRHVQVLTTSLEGFECEPESFDLVLAATAMHWIDPAARYHKSALLLKDAGVVAVVRNTHPHPFTGFFLETGAVYHRLVPEWNKRTAEPEDPGSEIPAELEQSGLFEQVVTSSYHWSMTFSQQDYLRLLHTFSDHLRLGEERLNRLCDAIGELIDKRYGGSIERPYETIMVMGRKRSLAK